jgi:hypothetical protein
MTVDRWINRLVPGKSFADVGPLWGTLWEKITVAAAASAASLTAIDHTPWSWSDPSWKAFREHATARGVTSVQEICADADCDDFAEKCGRHDIVHCNGVLYHTPDPVHMLLRLASITNDYLLLGTIHLGRFGQLGIHGFNLGELPGSIFVPALTDKQRQSIAEAYRFPPQAPATGISTRCDIWIKDGQREAVPFWWLHSVPVLQSMIQLAGFTIEDMITTEEPDCWEGRIVKFLCRKK